MGLGFVRRVMVQAISPSREDRRFYLSGFLVLEMNVSHLGFDIHLT